MGGRGLTIALAGVLALSACSAPPTFPMTTPPESGGKFTIGVVALDVDWANPDGPPLPPFEYVLDPQHNYIDLMELELLRCCLQRTLYSYNGLSLEEGGADLRPDLAATMPDVSADGLTWTVTLRKGIHYAPPFDDIEVTSHDLVRSMERIFTPFDFNDDEGRQWDHVGDEFGSGKWPHIGSWWAGYLDVVAGAMEFADGQASTIAGLATPDANTITFTLTEPLGDFGERLGVVALSPIAPGAWSSDDPMANYAPFQSTTGPYMIAGAGSVDHSLPAHDRPAPDGWQRGQRIRLVRNPSWDRTSDDLRWALLDEIEVLSMAPPGVPDGRPYVDDLVRGFADGRLDLPLAFGGLWEDIAPHAAATHRVETLLVQSLYFNLAHPPFDDVNVRRAVAYSLNRAEYARLFDPAYALISHLSPDVVTGGILADYDPYRTPRSSGDLELARAAMRKATAYDTDGDGVCDHDACAGIILAGPFSEGADQESGELLRAALGKIGIQVTSVDYGDPDLAFSFSDDIRTPIFSAGYFGDYPSAANFIGVQFAVDNVSLLNRTPDQLSELGYPVTDVPNVLDRLARCRPLSGSEGRRCWAELEQYLMENIVPQVPLMVQQALFGVSSRVGEVHIDQFHGMPAFDKISLAPE